jgi:3-phenylpropionate/trans-cinnamate dioxygenase ferredoxin reductase subunit
VPGRVVVVGAAMAGLRAAEALRNSGWPHEIVIVGDEPLMPYNRPPLSKTFLAGTGSGESLFFPVSRRAGDIVWRLGSTVSRADLDRHLVFIGDESLAWDGLIIATGLRPRRLTSHGPDGGRHVLRTREDAIKLRTALRTASHLVVLGAGFVGCEVALTARAMGLRVDVVAPESVPIARPLGLMVGAELRRRHELNGIQFHLGVVPTGFGRIGRTHTVMLSDGCVLEAEVIVEAIGCVPNVEWLKGNGLDLSDGVLSDSGMRVEGRADITACGDVARFPNLLFDDTPRRVEHWATAADTGKQAGRSLAAALTGSAPSMAATFTPIPSFWSDQGDVRIRSFGWLLADDSDIRILEGDLRDEVVVGYHRAGDLVGVLLLGASGRAAYYRNLIAARTPTASV